MRPAVALAGIALAASYGGQQEGGGKATGCAATASPTIVEVVASPR